jgi:DNA-binding transcriptional MerR regulator
VAVTTEQVNQLYGQLLGRSGQDQYLEGWADSGMSIDQIAEAIADSPEGQAYQASQNQPGDSPPDTGAGTETYTYTDPGTTTNISGQATVGSNNPVQGTIEVLFEREFGRMPTSEETQRYLSQYNQTGDMNTVSEAIIGDATPTTPAVTTGQVDALYQELLGRQGADEYLQGWANSGMTLNEIRMAIADTPEGQAYAASQTGGSGSEANPNQAILDAIKAQQEAQQAQQQALLDQLAAQRQAQADQLAAQQQAQADMFSTYGQAAKGGRGQQPQSAFGGAAPQPTAAPSPASPANVDTGGGYYRNPYSSGYGMGYQNPFASQMYLPQSGLMGPSGFGGKGGYRQPMPYGGMSPGKGGYYGGTPGPSDPAGDTAIPVVPPTEGATAPPPTPAGATPPAGGATPPPMYPMYPMRPMYPMYGGKGGYYR